MAAVLLLIGLALCAATTPGGSWRRVLAVVAALAIAVVGVLVQPSGAIVATDNVYTQTEPWNGYRVFLSSPRHIDSGSRGECGIEENENGWRVNNRAADGTYYNESYQPTSPLRNLRVRNYRVMVSRNVRDDGFLANRDTGNNWGAHVYVVTHTNAQSGGCGGSTQYLLTMFQPGGSSALATQLKTALDPPIPNGANQWSQSLAELNANAPHKAYVEFIFHTNQLAVAWFEANHYKVAWRYGMGIDTHLNYP
jgi:hypothetical protein